MSTFVKICGITSPADGVAAANAGADAIGLMFYERSSRNVSVAAAAEIARELPPHVIKTGVFVDAPEDFVMRAVNECGLNMLQFHGSETPEYCRQFPLMIVKAFRVRDAEALRGLVNYATDAWLLDAYVEGVAGGTGSKFNWELAVEAGTLGRPVILAGGLTPENVGDAVRLVRPFGVDVSSGVEISPGKKAAAKLLAFVEAAKNA